MFWSNTPSLLPTLGTPKWAKSLFWSNSPSLLATFGDRKTAQKLLWEQHSITFGYFGDPTAAQKFVFDQHSITFRYFGDPEMGMLTLRLNSEPLTLASVGCWSLNVSITSGSVFSIFCYANVSDNSATFLKQKNKNKLVNLC